VGDSRSITSQYGPKFAKFLEDMSTVAGRDDARSLFLEIAEEYKVLKIVVRDAPTLDQLASELSKRTDRLRHQVAATLQMHWASAKRDLKEHRAHFSEVKGLHSQLKSEFAKAEKDGLGLEIKADEITSVTRQTVFLVRLFPLVVFFGFGVSAYFLLWPLTRYLFWKALRRVAVVSYRVLLVVIVGGMLWGWGEGEVHNMLKSLPFRILLGLAFASTIFSQLVVGPRLRRIVLEYERNRLSASIDDLFSARMQVMGQTLCARDQLVAEGKAALKAAPLF
jgi:hypothetical protein